jgi:hypothetical protein
MIRALRSSASRRLVKTTATSTLTKATFATQSGNDASRPTALAKLYLEDGTSMTGLSFGSHESVEGEVSKDETILLVFFYRKAQRISQPKTLFLFLPFP